MISMACLRWVVQLEGLLLVTMVGLFFSHGAWLWWYRRRDEPRLRAAQGLVAAALDGDGISPASRDCLRRLPLRLQLRLFADLVPSLAGAQHQQLRLLAQEIGILARTERRGRSRLWWRRLQSARLLTLLGGGATVVPALFTDRRAIVRAQAAAWAIEHPGPEVLAALLALLDDANGLCRFMAQNALLAVGSDVLTPLTALLSRATGQQLEAALLVAIGLAEAHFLPVALRCCQDASPRVRALAATLLGTLGGQEGTEALRGLLRDPSAEVRAAAATALGALGAWPSAATLAALLRDASWTVRRAAGLALHAFGAPGVLFLRRALHDEDHFAADMARQVLDFPSILGTR